VEAIQRSLGMFQPITGLENDGIDDLRMAS
jgi:hypothetical protein